MSRVAWMAGFVTAAMLLAGCARPAATPLAEAAIGGDVPRIVQLLADGAPPDARSGANGWTPLMHAIARHQAAAVATLLAHGADPNLVAGQRTALMLAASSGDAALVELLIAHGADIRYRSADGIDALVAALTSTADGDRPVDCRTDTVRVLRRHAPDLQLPHSMLGLASEEIARDAGCGETLALLTAVEE